MSIHIISLDVFLVFQHIIIYLLGLSNSDNKLKDVDSLLHLACKERNLKKVKRLFEQGLLDTRNKDGWTPLHTATFYNYLPIVQFLVAQSANLEAKDDLGQTALYLASWKGHLELINFLTQNGADMEACDIR